jgi:FlaA1/EpsC-like NDP-sugar epimerase
MNTQNNIKVIVVGAGVAGKLMVEDIVATKETTFEIVGFVDDNSELRGQEVADRPVLGAIEDLPRLVKEYAVEELLIALPSGRGAIVRRIIDITAGLNLSYKILPRTSEILLQDFSEDYVKHIRRIRPEDLLGAEIVKADQEDIAQKIAGRTVLITGAAGSIGSELSRQVAAYKAAKIIFYDWWENGTFELRNQLLEAYPEGEYEFIIGDIKDRKKLDLLMGAYKPDTVFHAAAYKHVPLMEANAAEAVKNNILGTKTVAELAIKHNVEKFILVSTDKAVNPTNIMGATKRAAETAIHILAESQEGTTFCAVRFGNVINSNGSVIPIFQRQIEKGGPVTVTHKEVTRFFMTIPEAVHLILRAWTIGENNDLFVLDMGESVRIYDLARTLIALEGYVPNEEVKIVVTGLRPGEKLYEEVLMDSEDLDATVIDKVFRTHSHVDTDKAIFLVQLYELLDMLNDDGLNIAEIRTRMQQIVPTYTPAVHE